jgi:rhodanese-related sulfurtransferase
MHGGNPIRTGQELSMIFFKRTQAAALSPQDAVQGARKGTVTVIDVRDHTEVTASGKARGALHIPLMRLRDMADPQHPDFQKALKQAGTIAVYCASGARSFSARRTLQKLGYDDVHNIGGLGHWQQAGGAMERA